MSPALGRAKPSASRLYGVIPYGVTRNDLQLRADSSSTQMVTERRSAISTPDTRNAATASIAFYTQYFRSVRTVPYQGDRGPPHRKRHTCSASCSTLASGLEIVEHYTDTEWRH